MRHIKEIYKLPVSELTDEEIVKAALYRLKTNFALLVYHDKENKCLNFIHRYKTGGLKYVNLLKQTWEKKYGKLCKAEKNIYK